MHRIHSGFAEGISQLHSRTASLSTVPKEHGSPSRNYAGPMHVTVVGENLERHVTNLNRVSENTSLHGAIHAGAAGFINLAYMAHSKAAGGILFDINTYQKTMWDAVIDRLASQPDGNKFRLGLYTLASEIKERASRFAPVLRQDFEKACDAFGGAPYKTSSGHEFETWIAQQSGCSPEGAWMTDPKLYGHVHTLARENAIGSITLDIANEAACAEVSRYLHARKDPVKILYVSNILNFMQPVVRQTDFIGRNISTDMQQSAKENLYSWMADDGQIIECDNLSRNTPLLISTDSYKPRYVPA